MKLTHAEILGSLLGNDGTNWCTIDGWPYEDAIEALGGKRSVLKGGEIWEYTFRDGSKFFVSPACWSLSLDV